LVWLVLFLVNQRSSMYWPRVKLRPKTSRFVQLIRMKVSRVVVIWNFLFYFQLTFCPFLLFTLVTSGHWSLVYLVLAWLCYVRHLLLLSSLFHKFILFTFECLRTYWFSFCSWKQLKWYNDILEGTGWVSSNNNIRQCYCVVHINV